MAKRKKVGEAHAAYSSDLPVTSEDKAVQEQYIVDNKGKKVAVIIPFRRYQQLLEDLHDLTIVAERREEVAVPLAEMKRRLSSNGVI